MNLIFCVGGNRWREDGIDRLMLYLYGCQLLHFLCQRIARHSTGPVPAERGRYLAVLSSGRQWVLVPLFNSLPHRLSPLLYFGGSCLRVPSLKRTCLCRPSECPTCGRLPFGSLSVVIPFGTEPCFFCVQTRHCRPCCFASKKIPHEKLTEGRGLGRRELEGRVWEVLLGSQRYHVHRTFSFHAFLIILWLLYLSDVYLSESFLRRANRVGGRKPVGHSRAGVFVVEDVRRGLVTLLASMALSTPRMLFVTGALAQGF